VEAALTRCQERRAGAGGGYVWVCCAFHPSHHYPFPLDAKRGERIMRRLDASFCTLPTRRCGCGGCCEVGRGEHSAPRPQVHAARKVLCDAGHQRQPGGFWCHPRCPAPRGMRGRGCRPPACTRAQAARRRKQAVVAQLVVVPGAQASRQEEAHVGMSAYECGGLTCVVVMICRRCKLAAHGHGQAACLPSPAQPTVPSCCRSPLARAQ
jgi:hypothetical protein